MRKHIALTVAVLFLGLMLSSCVTSERTYQGAGAGGAIGAAAGALIDKNNRWRGALLGGALGGLLGGTVTEISSRASREAAQEGRPVTYQSDDGYQRIEAIPVAHNAQTKCTKVHEKVYQDGRVVKDQVRELCEGTKTERRY